MSSVVYFIQASSGAIKIGFTSDIRGRLASLQSSSAEVLTLIASLPGGKLEEQAVHGRFHGSRIKGEWFKPSPDLIDFINKLPIIEARSENTRKISQVSLSAIALAKALEDRMVLSVGNRERARKLLEQETGVPASVFWAARYRPTNAIAAYTGVLTSQGERLLAGLISEFEDIADRIKLVRPSSLSLLSAAEADLANARTRLAGIGRPTPGAAR